MAQLLRGLPALAEDLYLVPRTHIGGLQLTVTPVPEGQLSLLASTGNTHINTLQTNTHTHKIYKFLKYLAQ